MIILKKKARGAKVVMEKYRFSKKNKKTFKDIKNMGVDIDKNEYMEIVLSNSAHPENIYNKHKNNY